MFILKAYRNSATFEQNFEFEGAYQDKLKWLQDNGWTIGNMPSLHAHAFLNGGH